MRLVIAGGGTGGHLFPGIAVAESFLALSPDNEVLFVGTQRGIEARVVPQEGYRLECIEVKGLKGKGILDKIRNLWIIPKALIQSFSVLRKFKADAALGVGGYASGPVLLAAWLLGIPTAVCEQNSVPGLTNRVLGRLVRAIYGTFGHAQKYFPAQKYHLVGNPMRQQLVQGRETENKSVPNATPRILILGGSQGARALNETVPRAVALLEEEGVALSVLHQCGERDHEDVEKAYKDVRLEIEVKAFIKDMLWAYGRSDVAITRAGASTCTEVALMGIPSIMVPFPFATDDHQTLNAKELENAGGIKIIAQKEMTPTRLAQELKILLKDNSIHKEMTKNLKGVAKPFASQKIAQAVHDGFRHDSNATLKGLL
tara:strand:- start:396 stop:1511 length:1116 start_codon:yes stop_codon:yes gene_type:complete